MPNSLFLEISISYRIQWSFNFPYTFPALKSAGYALAAVGTASPALSPLQPEDLKPLMEQQTSTVYPQATGAGDLDGSPILRIFRERYVHIYTYDSMI